MCSSAKKMRKIIENFFHFFEIACIHTYVLTLKNASARSVENLKLHPRSGLLLDRKVWDGMKNAESVQNSISNFFHI